MKPRTSAQVVLASGMLSPPTAAEGGPHVPARARHPAVHRGEGHGRIDDRVPRHHRECGKCGGRGDAGGRDAHAASRIFAAWAGAAGRYHQDPVRATVWRGAASGACQSVSSRWFLPSRCRQSRLCGFFGGWGWLVPAAINQTKLSASRFLRVRKLALHVSHCFSSLSSSVLSGWPALI